MSIDKILDENCDENIFLYNEEGEAVEFEQIAVIPMDDETYVILRPVVLLEGMNEDEALVFVIETVDGEEALTIVEDDAVVDAVFDAYYALLKEYEDED